MTTKRDGSLPFFESENGSTGGDGGASRSPGGRSAAAASATNPPPPASVTAGIIPRRNVRLLTALNAGNPLYSPIGTNGVADAAVEITFTSINNPGGDESYNVHVRLRAQPQPDPRITPWGAPPWETPDVWVDSSREGAEDGAGDHYPAARRT